MDARRKDVATQDEFDPRLRELEMVGRAVLTTLPSKADKRIGIQTAVKHLQNPGPRRHPPDGSAGDGFSFSVSHESREEEEEHSEEVRGMVEMTTPFSLDDMKEAYDGGGGLILSSSWMGVGQQSDLASMPESELVRARVSVSDSISVTESVSWWTVVS